MKYPIEVILSITHPRLLTRIENIYEILNWMLDDSLYTHQLPRAAKFCGPFLLAAHPQLSEWDIHSEAVNKENWREYVVKAQEMFGRDLEIEKCPAGVWTYRDAVEEAEEMVGKDRVEVVSFPRKDGE